MSVKYQPHRRGKQTTVLCACGRMALVTRDGQLCLGKAHVWYPRNRSGSLGDVKIIYKVKEKP